MQHHAVIVAGAGPTGLTLASELALAGVDVAIVERRPDQELTERRAGGLHARTIEMLDQRGIADRFLAAGQKAQVAGFAWIRLDISDAPSRHNYGLALRQSQIERLLAEWAAELHVPIYRTCEVSGFMQDAEGVDVALSDGRTLRAQYLVGCDGGRSLIRKTAGIAFPGWEGTSSNILAELEVETEPPLGLRHDANGIHAFSRIEAGRFGVMVTEHGLGPQTEPTLAELSAALIDVYGTDFGARNPAWISRFTDAARQAENYRAGRVLLAGDAAHVHPPVGGQGLNIGVQDAMNLGWKLARVVTGTSPQALLDTYHAERHPIGARVLRDTVAQMVLLRRLEERLTALREVTAELFAMDEPRKRFGALMSGLEVRYDLGGEHPLAGRRMPDIDLDTARGTQRAYTLLHDARYVLLNLGVRDEIGAADLPAGVKRVDATYVGRWELPVAGTVTAPAAVLIRPDGYVERVWE